MRTRALVTLALATMVAVPLPALQVTVSGGDVSRTTGRGDPARLSPRIPGVDSVLRGRVVVSGDSAQRIAMHDFAWKGRVSSVEIDEADTRVFWDVKVVPDTSQQTIVRYRVDARTGAILSVKPFSGVRGLMIRKP